MNEQEIKMFLSHLGVDNAELHGDWVRSSCPLAFARHKSGKDSNPSFGVTHVPGGKSGFNCFGCNIKGKTLDGLLTETMYALQKQGGHSDINLEAAFKMIEDEGESGYLHSDWTGKIYPAVSGFEEWPNWYLDSFMSVFKSPEAMAYLNSRGVAYDLWDVFSLRFDATRQTVCFPFFNRDNKLSGMRGRFIKPKGDFRYYDYKWNNVNNTSLIWMGENHLDYLKPVVVVEGMFDYAAVYRVYPNVVANLSTGLSEQKVKKLENAVQIVGFFDNDEAGKIASVLLGDRFKGGYVEVDYGSSKAKDPGSMSWSELINALRPYVNV